MIKSMVKDSGYDDFMKDDEEIFSTVALEEMNRMAPEEIIKSVSKRLIKQLDVFQEYAMNKLDEGLRELPLSDKSKDFIKSNFEKTIISASKSFSKKLEDTLSKKAKDILSVAMLPGMEDTLK